MICVRTLREDEAMPQHLGTGYEQMPIMKSFCWVAEQEGKIIGVLLAAPCHGIVYLIRLCVEKGAPVITAGLLFRKCLRECKEAGFVGYFAHIDPSRETERELIAICRKAKGIQIGMMQVPLVGSIEQAARF